jgi:hypothetical protein
MTFKLAHGVVYRLTPPYGCTVVSIAERAVGGRWELAGSVPREATDLPAADARTRLGALADEESVFATEPETTSAGGLSGRVEQLDTMIDMTVTWLRAAAVGSDQELSWASYQSWDHDYEIDNRVAITHAAELLARMVEHRRDLLSRAALRDSRDVD